MRRLGCAAGARRRDDERGAVAVMVAVMAVVIFIICGLVVDLGNARVQRSRAQDAADAASLAAANALYASGTANLTAAVTAAETYADDNFDTTAADWAGCTDSAHLAVTSSVSSCISFDSATAPTTVRVLIPTRNIPTTFGRLAGVDNMAVNAAADATVKPGGRAICGLCVVGSGTPPKGHDIQNGDITITGASVYFNGDLSANSNGSIAVTGTGSTISTSGAVLSGTKFTPAVLQHQPTISDPLASLTLPPSTVGLKTMPAGTSACTGGPGIYIGSFNFPQNGTCTLTPDSQGNSLYVLAGNTQDQSGGNANVVAQGVTLYFTCESSTSPPQMQACNSNGQNGAGINLTGNASLTFSAPTTGPTQGLAIVSDRYNTTMLAFRGNGSSQSTGTIYALDAKLEYDGNGSGAALDSLTVVNDITFNGNNAAFNSQYTQSKNYQLPPGQPYLSQ